MITASLAWQQGRNSTTGSVAATIAMAEDAWAEAGGSFTTVPDGLGGHARLAVGIVELDGQPTEFGVRAYEDDAVSHLIVGGPYEDRSARTSRLVSDLLAAGAIANEGLVLEIVGLAEPASADDKLDYVVDIVEATVSEAHRTLQEQVRQMQAAVEAIVSQRAISEIDVIPALTFEPSGFNVLPIVMRGIRNLVVLHGIAHAADYDEQVSIRTSAALFPTIVRLQDLAQRATLLAQLVRFDAAAGEAVVTIEVEEGRIPLVIGGFGHSFADFEEVTFPAVTGTVADPYADQSPQQTFDLYQHRLEAKSPSQRWIRFRIAR